MAGKIKSGGKDMNSRYLSAISVEQKTNENTY